MQQSVARGMQAAGENGGGAAGMAFMGMGLNGAGSVMGGLQQPVQQTNNAPEEDPYEKLAKLLTGIRNMNKLPRARFKKMTFFIRRFDLPISDMLSLISKKQSVILLLQS